MLRELLPPLVTSGLLLGGKRESKFSFLLASRAAALGVFAVPGVLGQLPCAGLGVTLQKSEKLKFCDGVLNPNPKSPLVPPGVDIIDDGSGVVFDGGVEGAMMRAFEVPSVVAGVGEFARCMSKSTPSSSVRGVRDHEMLSRRSIVRR